MGEHHNEVHGRDINAPIVQANRIDHLRINVGDVPPEVEHPPLTSWHDRPELTRELDDLLTAQREATQALPYALLGVREPDLLNDVYVRQSLRPEPHTDRAAERDRRASTSTEPAAPEPAEFSDRPVSVTEALNQGGHLVITGEPGAGKSTLGYMYVQRLSAYWLDAGQEWPPLTEPVLPLRVPARALAGKKPWDTLLAEGVSEALAGFLGTHLRPEVLGRRPLGARWLVFVDGLDEIVEPGIKQQVIRTIAYRMRKNPHQRLVVTTRPLPDPELESLCRDHADHFRIEPFGLVELEEFARLWFRSQDPITAPERAADFLRQVRDNRLSDLVRNPLLATISAITLTVRPDRPLPNNLADLFQGFMNHLLTESASGRTTVADRRESLVAHPLRLQVFDWMARHRDIVITRLAMHRLASEGSLFEAATAYVAEHQNTVDPADLPDGWPDDLRAVLDGSGVFSRAGEDLTFWHHSFAEFLAARGHAAEIPPGFPELSTWIDRGLAPATQQFALFTIVLWSRREGCDIAVVFERLMSGQYTDVLLAARLLAQGVGVPQELTTQVLDRLIDLIVCGGVLDTNRAGSWTTGEVLASLTSRVVGARTIDRLRLLRDRPEVATTTRIACAAALGYLTGPEDAIRWLERFAAEVDPKTLDHIVDVLPGLSRDGTDRAERLLVRLGEAAGADYVEVLAAATMLVRLDRKTSSARLIRMLVRRLRHDPDIAPDTPVMPHSQNDGRRPRIRDAWQMPSPTWEDLAKTAADTGCRDETLWAARRSLALPRPSDDELNGAAAAMLAVDGADAVAEIETAAESRPPAPALGLATALAEADFADAAGRLARRILPDRRASDGEIATAAGLFLSTPDGTPEAMLTLVRERGELTIDSQLNLADAMKEAGAPIEAAQIIRRFLGYPAIDTYDFWQAANILLDCGDPTAAEAVAEAALAHSPEHCGEAAPLLADAGREDLARELMQRLFQPVSSFDTLMEMAGWFRGDRQLDLLTETVDVALPLAEQEEPANVHKLVEALAAIGRTAEAVTLARRNFALLVAADQNPQQMTTAWLEAGGTPSASDIVAELTVADVRAEWRVEIAQELAEAGLLSAAVAVWLDVVQWHGDAVDYGIAAAARLVACGCRDQTIEAIRETLADAPAHPGLRALLGWVVLSSPNATAAELRLLQPR